MSSLDTQIRDHIDAIATPITFDEVQQGSAMETRAQVPRWAVGSAAAVIAVLGLAAFVVSTNGRNEPAVQPTVPPPTSTSTVDTVVPTVQSIEIDVPPGLTVDDIGALLAASVESFDVDEFEAAAIEAAQSFGLGAEGLESAEGFLAPGTYTFTSDVTASEVAVEMVTAMDELTDAAGIDSDGKALGRAPYEILIIASMIEREANVPSDRDGISRVIHNRLFVTSIQDAEPFPLQIDSAVLYGRERLGIDTDVPFSELRQIPSDWNTYILPGLPATPIASPSRESIEAALRPRPNPGPTDPLCVDLPDPDACFLFFYVLADEDGSMRFAATVDQHAANVEAALELGLL